MRNHDEVDLYRRVSVDTQVVVLDGAMRQLRGVRPSFSLPWRMAPREAILAHGQGARPAHRLPAPRGLAARRWPLGLAELASCPSCASATEVGETLYSEP